MAQAVSRLLIGHATPEQGSKFGSRMRCARFEREVCDQHLRLSGPEPKKRTCVCPGLEATEKRELPFSRAHASFPHAHASFPHRRLHRRNYWMKMLNRATAKAHAQFMNSSRYVHGWFTVTTSGSIPALTLRCEANFERRHLISATQRGSPNQLDC
jgi:hypothetical protein